MLCISRVNRPNQDILLKNYDNSTKKKSIITYFDGSSNKVKISEANLQAPSIKDHTMGETNGIILTCTRLPNDPMHTSNIVQR